MDILIKNTELPKDSSYQLILTVQHDGSVSVEGESFIRAIAIELPPHGRCIDAEEFSKRVLERWHTADKEKEKLISEIIADIIVPIIASTPTVIEASV